MTRKSLILGFAAAALFCAGGIAFLARQSPDGGSSGKGASGAALDFDVSTDLRVHGKAELMELRARLRRAIWRDSRLHDRQPDAVEENHSTRDFGLDSKALKVIRLTVAMEFGINSFPVMFVSAGSRECLMVYHQGHGGSFLIGREIIKQFLLRGCDVIAYDMPLKGGNNHAQAEIGGTRFPLHTHDDLDRLASADFNPIKLFVEPVAVGLNYALARRNYGKVGMIGFSGGGWTAILSAALDPRIQAVYHIAGVIPFHLSRKVKLAADWEQNRSDIFRIVNYLELFLLGVAERDRRSMNIYGRHDKTFPFFKERGKIGFGEQLEGVARDWRLGKLRFVLDKEIRGHGLSLAMRRRIENDFFRGNL